MTGSKPEQPDSPPKHLHIGAINPFALVEAILGRKVDWNEAATARVLSSILQTDYEELFDMRFKSILYAGTRLNDRGDQAELIPAKDMHTLTERDLVTPDFSKVEKLGDLGHMGLKDLDNMRVKHALMSNGNLRLTLEQRTVGKTLCSSEMTRTLRELCTPFRLNEKEEWTPPNGSWADIGGCYHQDPATFSNPVQGAASNSWLVAALMSVAWSDPSVIKHCTRRHSSSSSCGHEDSSHKTRDCSLSVKLHSKGGDNDASTTTVTVNCELPTNNSSSLLMYCRPSSMSSMAPTHMIRTWGGDLWPALYEKAFAAWLTGSHSSSAASTATAPGGGTSRSSEHPDLTQTAHGDPIKAMAQLTDKNPQYFFTSARRGADLLGLVRTHCVNQSTVFPTVAWTKPSDEKFRGCTLVGNMAYSVLGWAAPQERKQYIVLRHPWGVTEPEGMTSYPGVVARVDAKFWPPVQLVDEQGAGVFAIETGYFKEYFAGMGVAK
ncbi:hypothetical protein C8A01DRAFT_45365 [Parachaetomium inaequale]|uniref:Calpain catalytic domain-containing protein n=1 Tax=Parachaetomium inaequale TaxID=2588326 RepID=A0AAN6PKA1_9PEZI|nr:hypothetical protein C8A01DRAFT_45365 [Parachaetomium inaequale]